MSDERIEADAENEVRSAKRRAFLRSATKVAVTAPAVTLLLSVGTMKTVKAISVM